MALIPVTRETLGSKRLKPVTSYAFAAQASLCEIVLSEFPAIAANYPIFFFEKDGHMTPGALLGLNGDDNLFVEADGGWSGGYVPAMFRHFPFLLQNDKQGTPQLVIDEHCPLLSDSEGEALFGTDEQSDLASPVGRALNAIAQLQTQSGPTRAVIAKIKETGVLQPITLAVDASEAKRSLAGLHAIHAPSLDALPDETLLDLRRAGALMPIYAHLVSLSHVATLKARSRFRMAMAASRQSAN